MFLIICFNWERLNFDKVSISLDLNFSVPVSLLVRLLAPRVNGCNYRETGPVRSYPRKRDQRRVRTHSSCVSRYSCLDVRYFIHTRLWFGDFTFTVSNKPTSYILRSHSCTQVWWDSCDLMTRGDVRWDAQDADYTGRGCITRHQQRWQGNRSPTLSQRADHNSRVRHKPEYRHPMHWFLRYIYPFSSLSKCKTICWF